MCAALRIALSTVLILTGLGFSPTSISFRAHIRVAANRIANFLSSVMGGSASGYAVEDGRTDYTPDASVVPKLDDLKATPNEKRSGIFIEGFQATLHRAMFAPRPLSFSLEGRMANTDLIARWVDCWNSGKLEDNTAFGPVFIGGSVGDTGHSKWFFQLGRVF